MQYRTSRRITCAFAPETMIQKCKIIARLRRSLAWSFNRALHRCDVTDEKVIQVRKTTGPCGSLIIVKLANYDSISTWQDRQSLLRKNNLTRYGTRWEMGLVEINMER